MQPAKTMSLRLSSFRTPVARIEEARWLARHDVPRAMLDLSDGESTPLEGAAIYLWHADAEGREGADQIIG